MDDQIYLQQAAGSTKVVYNAYYNYKLAKNKGLKDFSDSRADKEFWYQNIQESEKDILWLKTHEQSLVSNIIVIKCLTKFISI